MTDKDNNCSVLLQHYIAPSDAVCLSKDGVLSKQTMLAAMQRHFVFPDYFGGNFDAAYDLLLDVVDSLNMPAKWHFCTGKLVTTDTDALESWLQVMQDVMLYAKTKGMPLQVILFIEPC